MNPINRLFRRLLPKDPDSTDRPGAFGIYFEGPLWDWLQYPARYWHDPVDDRREAGETDISALANDLKLLEATKKEIELGDYTPFQKRIRLVMRAPMWIAIRTVRRLRGEK